MADKTTNYNLIKPTPDDFYDIEVFNENADIIDAELKKLKDAIENLNIENITLPDGKTIAEKFNEIETEIGNIEELDTDEKANIVAAINEIYQALLTHQQNTNQEIGQIASDLAAHKAEKVHVPHLGTTTNNGNNYSIATNIVISENSKFSVTFNAAATGTATLNISSIGSAKPLKKPGGGDFKPKAGPYTLFYDGSNFFVLGEGGEYGTALPEHVLEGYTIGTEQGIVAGTMPNQGAKIIIPSTVNQAIPAGFHNGLGYVQGSANLKPENIKSGVNIFNVIGTLKPITDEKKVVIGTGTFTITVYSAGYFAQYIPLTSLSITPEGFFVYLDGIQHDYSHRDYPNARYIAATIKENGVWNNYTIQEAFEYTTYGVKTDYSIAVTYEENNQRLKISGSGGFSRNVSFNVSFKWWAFGN